MRPVHDSALPNQLEATLMSARRLLRASSDKSSRPLEDALEGVAKILARRLKRYCARHRLVRIPPRHGVPVKQIQTFLGETLVKALSDTGAGRRERNRSRRNALGFLL